jgi:hypothetical protein
MVTAHLLRSARPTSTIQLVPIRREVGRGTGPRPVVRMEVLATRIPVQSQTMVATEDRVRFAQFAKTEVLSLHEGKSAQYRIRPPEFGSWRQAREAR